MNFQRIVDHKESQTLGICPLLHTSLAFFLSSIRCGSSVLAGGLLDGIDTALSNVQNLFAVVLSGTSIAAQRLVPVYPAVYAGNGLLTSQVSWFDLDSG